MKLPCRAQSDGIGRSVVKPLRRRGTTVIKEMSLTVLGIVSVLLTSACVQQQEETEAFPGVGFGEGKNNMLNYPEDSGRTEYTGERLGHRSRGDVMVAVDNAQERPIPEPETIHLLDTKGIQAEVDQNSSLSGADGPISPTPLLDGDVVLEEPQVIEVRAPEVPRHSPEIVQLDGAAPWQNGIFLASYRSSSDARDGWDGMRRRFDEQLGGLRADVLEVDLGAAKGGLYYRLFAAPLENGAHAAAVCRVLESASQFCRTATAGGRIRW
jgi:hypothetical protein